MADAARQLGMHHSPLPPLRSWTPDKPYMAPPKRGKVAALDTALLVRPPEGLGVGYVPVAIRQDPAR